MFLSGCSCCGCAPGSGAAADVYTVIRAASSAALTWTDNGVWEYFPLADIQGVFLQSDLPASSIPLALDLGYSSGVRFVSPIPSGRKYQADITFVVSSSPATSTAWPYGQCLLVAVGTLRFFVPGRGEFASAVATYSQLTIASDVSLIEAQTSNIRAAGLRATQAFANNLFSPMGLRFEFDPV